MLRFCGYFFIIIGIPLLIFCWPGAISIGLGCLLLIAGRRPTVVVGGEFTEPPERRSGAEMFVVGAICALVGGGAAVYVGTRFYTGSVLQEWVDSGVKPRESTKPVPVELTPAERAVMVEMARPAREPEKSEPDRADTPVEPSVIEVIAAPEPPKPAPKPSTEPSEPVVTGQTWQQEDDERRAQSTLGLGRSLVSMGKNTEAKGWFQRVISDFPDTQAAKEAEDELKRLEK